VCEEYRLRRETYHVAIDFIDRFLSRTSSISRRQLQLIGISALFVAAKVEVSIASSEYQPKIGLAFCCLIYLIIYLIIVTVVSVLLVELMTI
jgi:hypothetical protein